MIYPEGNFTTMTVSVGGRSKQELLAQLAETGVELNEAARILFASDRFTPSRTNESLVTVELAVKQLGFAKGATTAELHHQAIALGLSLAPPELGPHLRLQCLDQPEGYWGYPVTEHRAPPGSIAVASAPLSEDDSFPKGFYLRRIKGILWLRGYWCDKANVWDAEDRLVFCKPRQPAKGVKPLHRNQTGRSL